jgi:hypothetical protein
VRSIEEVIRDRGGEMLAIPGVTVVYEGVLDDGTPCVVVGVVDREAPAVAAIPAVLEAHPVSVRETGPLEAR